MAERDPADWGGPDPAQGREAPEQPGCGALPPENPGQGRGEPPRERSTRVMAIDYGDARTGVAVSDAAGLLAGYTAVIQARRPERAAEEIAGIVRERQVGELVMGFPRNMDGTEGPRGALYRAFAALVEERTGLPVRLWDERRTTIEAHQILHASGKRMKDHRKNVDAVAASLILEGYLTWRRRRQ